MYVARRALYCVFGSGIHESWVLRLKSFKTFDVVRLWAGGDLGRYGKLGFEMILRRKALNRAVDNIFFRPMDYDIPHHDGS